MKHAIKNLFKKNRKYGTNLSYAADTIKFIAK